MAVPVALGAQQTVINAPSVDQTPKGRVFALHESQLRAWGDTSFWQTTHFVTYGLTPQLELAVTAYNIGTPLKRQATLGVGWKGAIDMPGVSDGPPGMFGKSTTHFVGSFEQPLASLPGAVGHALHDFTLLGEWWGGRHEFADFVPGINYHRGKQVVILGYKFTNLPGTRGDGIVLEFGRTF